MVFLGTKMLEEGHINGIFSCLLATIRMALSWEKRAERKDNCDYYE
jgi:hypothetical protein